jgi:hypothetical protein
VQDVEAETWKQFLKIWCGLKNILKFVHINKIFIYLELTDYYPLQNILLVEQCALPNIFSTFGSTVRRMFLVLTSGHSLD